MLASSCSSLSQASGDEGAEDTLESPAERAKSLRFPEERNIWKKKENKMRAATTNETESEPGGDSDKRVATQMSSKTTSSSKPPAFAEVSVKMAGKRNVEANGQGEVLYKASIQRYFILAMYGICSMEKSFQWINLSAITNKVALYYGVDNIAVNWTSVLFMITFIPLVLPTGWLIERIGLRRAVLIGATGITAGAVIKSFAGQEDRFWVIIVGQIVISLSEQFIFCIPARIASVWFPDSQVSLATGFGIFGNQCGIALGYLVPQLALKGMETRDEIGVGLKRLLLWTAVVTFGTWIVLLFAFAERPKYAPGAARYRKIQEEREQRDKRLSLREEMKVFGQTLCVIFKDSNSILLIIAYGINVAVTYSIQTCLNQLIAGSDWEGANEIIGASGLIVIFSGMCGALFWGHLCDRTHRYILINRILYVGAILAILLFALTLKLYNEYYLYAASSLMGFLLIGYTAVGLDTMVELTYPVPELLSTSVMNLSPQLFGVPMTFACSAIVDRYESDWASAFLIGALLVGLVFTALISENLKRQKVVNEHEQERKMIELK